MTAQLFLEQVASDYRRVASCQLDLREVEARRNTAEGATALERAGVVSRPVAPLAVGQHLAAQHGGAVDLARVFGPWIGTVEKTGLQSRYGATFGDVLGPLVLAALDNSPAGTSLPDWSGRVGEMWCAEFFVAAAEILRSPALLSGSHIEGRAITTARQGSADITETANKVVALAEAFRAVEDVRVSAAGNVPKVELVLSGDVLSKAELDQLMAGAETIGADVAILPS